MPDFDPLNPLMSFLLGYDSDVVRDVLYRTGVPANFELNERERFSHRIRSSAYDQRFRRAYNELDDNQKYRASYIIAERLVAIDVGNQDRLNGSLNNIGWRIEDGKLMAELPEVRELFFPPGSQYDAYSGIKSIIDLAQDSIMVVDNYVDPMLFTMLAMLDKKNVKTQVLTHNTGQNAAAQGDFNLAAKKFTQQYPNLPITIRLSADFHDRFLILDGQRCFHIGASIKDAGKKAFLISEAEDPNNRTALMTQATQTWTAANAYIISAG